MSVRYLTEKFGFDEEGIEKMSKKISRKMTKNVKNGNIYHVINIFVIIVIGFGTFLYSIDPDLTDFRNSIYGLLVDFLALSGIMLWITLSRIINMPLLGKITVWLYGLLFLLLGIFDFGRIELLFFFIYAIVNVGVAVFLYEEHSMAHICICLFGILSYLKSVYIIFRVEHLLDDFASPCLWITIILSIIIFIPCLIYGIKGFKADKNWEKIALPFCVLLISFVFVYSTVASMNVYLDTSLPIYEEYIIVDKDIEAGAREVTTYELEVKKGDTTFTIGVSDTTYYSYEINDTIRLSLYEGAFNDPYYIHEDNGS